MQFFLTEYQPVSKACRLMSASVNRVALTIFQAKCPLPVAPESLLLQTRLMRGGTQRIVWR